MNRVRKRWKRIPTERDDTRVWGVWQIAKFVVHHCYPHVKAPPHLDDRNSPNQDGHRSTVTRQTNLGHTRSPSTATHPGFQINLSVPSRQVGIWRLVGWFQVFRNATVTGDLLPVNFRRGCVVTDGWPRQPPSGRNISRRWFKRPPVPL